MLFVGFWLCSLIVLFGGVFVGCGVVFVFFCGLLVVGNVVFVFVFVIGFIGYVVFVDFVVFVLSSDCGCGLIFVGFVSVFVFVEFGVYLNLFGLEIWIEGIFVGVIVICVCCGIGCCCFIFVFYVDIGLLFNFKDDFGEYGIGVFEVICFGIGDFFVCCGVFFFVVVGSVVL